MASYKLKRKLFFFGLKNFRNASWANQRAAAATRAAERYSTKMLEAQKLGNTNTAKTFQAQRNKWMNKASQETNVANQQNWKGTKNLIGGAALTGGALWAGSSLMNKATGEDANK